MLTHTSAAGAQCTHAPTYSIRTRNNEYSSTGSDVNTCVDAYSSTGSNNSIDTTPSSVYNTSIDSTPLATAQTRHIVMMMPRKPNICSVNSDVKNMAANSDPSSSIHPDTSIPTAPSDSIAVNSDTSTSIHSDDGIDTATSNSMAVNSDNSIPTAPSGSMAVKSDMCETSIHTAPSDSIAAQHSSNTSTSHLIEVPLYLVLSDTIPGSCQEVKASQAMSTVLASDAAWEIKIGAALLWVLLAADRLFTSTSIHTAPSGSMADTSTSIPTAPSGSKAANSDTSTSIHSGTSIPTAPSVSMAANSDTSIPTATSNSMAANSDNSIPTTTSNSMAANSDTSIPTAPSGSIAANSDTSIPTTTSNSMADTSTSISTAPSVSMAANSDTSIPTARSGSMADTSIPTATSNSMALMAADRPFTMSTLLTIPPHPSTVKSFWCSYAKLIPPLEEQTSLLTFSNAELGSLQDPGLHKKALAWQQAVGTAFESFINTEAFRSECEKSDLKAERMRSMFIWAVASVESRAFGVKVHGEELRGLVPFLDLANHHHQSQGSHHVNFSTNAFLLTRSEASADKLVSDRPISRAAECMQEQEENGHSEHEFFITYGAKSNRQLMDQYGFVVRGNPYDRLDLGAMTRELMAAREAADGEQVLLISRDDEPCPIPLCNQRAELQVCDTCPPGRTLPNTALKPENGASSVQHLLSKQNLAQYRSLTRERSFKNLAQYRSVTRERSFKWKICEMSVAVSGTAESSCARGSKRKVSGSSCRWAVVAGSRYNWSHFIFPRPAS
eukprot:gene6177-2792_t